MKKAVVLLAEGFEEVEALTPVDYLRRAGVEVKTIGVTGELVRGGHGITVAPDAGLSELAGEFDCVVVPGGGRGADELAASTAATAFIKRQFTAGKLVAAICAAPAVVLHEACGILKGRRFTGFPGTESRVTGAHFSAERVVVDGNLITSRSAGCAGEFSRAIVEALVGADAARELAERVLL
ncbi:MAG TPA: DJ-1 family glyoxalase III [Rectinemataceae bacterium]|nr:DJ-1 family glyoxalase III [Rectinemataceae bacterium]